MTTEGVKTGIDVLQSEGFRQLKNTRVGLVTNHTGLTRDGLSTIDALYRTPNVTLKALFGPEHGIRGVHDEDIADGIDQATGLPVYSLFGARTRPTPEQLQQIDTLVFDIQDIGCRFYTYISTLGNILEAASDTNLRIVILDRPNPITGLHLEGPIADDDKLTFTAYHPMPIRHGMTVGELARLFVTERNLQCPLEVVKCQGWQRSQWFDATGLPWTNPSPNMRSLYAATLYPGIGLLEFTNISVGRGTDRPFELLGAPFINARQFASELNAADLPGIRFIPTSFTPNASVYKDELCHGVALVITDRDALKSVTVGITIAHTLLRLYPNAYLPAKLMTLMANQTTFNASVSGLAPQTITDEWREGLMVFAARRIPCLMYE